MERKRGRQCKHFLCDLSLRKEPPISRSIAPEVFERSNKSSWDIPDISNTRSKTNCIRQKSQNPITHSIKERETSRV